MNCQACGAEIVETPQEQYRREAESLRLCDLPPEWQTMISSQKMALHDDDRMPRWCWSNIYDAAVKRSER